MERLSCTSTVNYNATEAAIHMARYQLAVPYCKGKSVLDIACGEGYGAFALKRLGAKTVDGVDNSPDALNHANALFSKPGIRFHLHDAECVDELFSDQRFEVIVCLETIEHLKDPTRFLRALQKVATESATVIITCPNDHWYYANEQSNPFHVRKYSFEAFRELTTAVLGNSASWAYGAPVIGFGAVADDLISGRDQLAGQVTMMEFRRQAAAIVMPPRGFASVGPRNCSYFVGVWGGETARVYTSAIVPISMDDYSNLVSWESARVSPRRLNELENERSALVIDKARLRQEYDEAQTEWKRLDTDYRRQLTDRGQEILELHGRIEAQAGELQGRIEAHAGELRGRIQAHARELEDVQTTHATRWDELTKERDRFRLQAFALAKEFDLVSVQTEKIRTERDQQVVKLQAVRFELETAQHELQTTCAELRAVRVELENAQHELQTTCVELARMRQQVISAIAAREGLRYLTKATARAYARRTALITIVRPARLIRPYLPASMLAAAQKVARALHIPR